VLVGIVDGVVAVVRDGNFLGVIADTEHAAETAINRLRSASCDSNVVATREIPSSTLLSAYYLENPWPRVVPGT